MAGIGSIGGGFSPYLVTPPARSATDSGNRLAGALGNKPGLGKSASGNRVRSGESKGASGITGSPEELPEAAQKEVTKLKQRDAEVRRHEQAHVAAAGRYAQGGPQFEFSTGPDGRQYATGGEVSIDVSPASSPEATIQKAQTIRRAALAPAEPSGQDRSVAAQASQLESRARQELQQAQQEKSNDEGTGSFVDTDAANPESGVQTAASILQRDFSEYVSESSNANSGGLTGLSRLDISV